VGLSLLCETPIVPKRTHQEDVVFEKPSLPSRVLRAASAAAFGAVLTVLGGIALAAQAPSGLAFSEFRGYEDWRVVAVSQTEEEIKVIVANPAMIEAYRAGVPGNGKKFPDGSKVAKIRWKPQKNAESPFPVNVPSSLVAVDFIERDSKRFADSGGWGYAPFNYNATSDTFAPNGSGTKCGVACHTAVASKDYIFTAYPKR